MQAAGIGRAHEWGDGDHGDGPACQIPHAARLTDATRGGAQSTMRGSDEGSGHSVDVRGILDPRTRALALCKQINADSRQSVLH